MKTTNWQTKALTLFIAAVALWFATACEGNPTVPKVITPSAPCGDNYGPLVPSRELQHLSGRDDWVEGRISSQDWNQAVMARNERLRPEEDRVRAILDKNLDLIRRHRFHHPDGNGWVRGWGVKPIQTETELMTDKHAIFLYVSEYVDQSRFPPDERIPECMDGIPVHFEINYGARAQGR